MAAQVECATTATPPAVFKWRGRGSTAKTECTPGIALAAHASKVVSLPTEVRAARDNGVEHPWHANIDAEARTAVRLRGDVCAGHVLADIAEVFRVFQGESIRPDLGQFGGSCHQLTVSQTAAAWKMDHRAVLRAALL